MCNRCEVYATGRTNGKPATLSKLFGDFACKHSPECKCDNCDKFRSRNEYADFGLVWNRPVKEE